MSLDVVVNDDVYPTSPWFIGWTFLTLLMNYTVLWVCHTHLYIIMDE